MNRTREKEEIKKATVKLLDKLLFLLIETENIQEGCPRCGSKGFYKFYLKYK